MRMKSAGHPIKIVFLFLLILIIDGGKLFAQSDIVFTQPERLDEPNYQDGNDAANSIAWEDQEEIRARPVNLNRLTEEELQSIPYLNSMQKKELMTYLKEFGQVLSPYELLAVRGFDSSIVKKIIPYICFLSYGGTSGIRVSELLKYGKNDLLVQVGTSFPRASGYSGVGNPGAELQPPAYSGSPYGISFRYTYHYKDFLSFGFSGDKDPGEQFFSGSQNYGMDFYSGYVCLKTRHVLKSIVAGNFRAGWGTGLTFNTGGSLGNYPGFMRELTACSGLRPSQSTSEYGLMRGIGLTLGNERLTFSAICSYRKRDATVSQEDTASGAALSFSSFSETGYHRTESENRKKSRVSELLAGGNINFRGNFFSIGASGYYSSYDASLQPRDELYNLNSFRGKTNFVSGVDCNLFYRNLRFAGEVSRSLNGSIAMIGSLNFIHESGFGFQLIYRKYPPSYQNPYSYSFRENSSAANEQGIYTGISANLPYSISLNLFTDMCRFPWARYNSVIPTAGNSFGAMITFQSIRDVLLSLRYIFSSSENCVTGGIVAIPVLTSVSSSALRIQLNWNVNPGLALQSRIEYKYAVNGSRKRSDGWLMFQDIILKTVKGKFGITFRYEIFDCPDYESRIWTWEPDLLYTYSMPSFYGKGMKACGMVRMLAGRHLVFGVKAAYIKYSDRSFTGSGPEQVNADWRLDLRVQCRIKI